MKLIYKKIEEKDKEQLFKLIDTVLSGLENQEYFIPYEQWELDSMFDEKNYAPLYGAYDEDNLVGMAQLYVSQDMLADFKKEIELENYTVCELGFDYIISMAHPDNIGSCKTLEKVGLNFVKETRLSNGFLRKLYMLKLK